MTSTKQSDLQSFGELEKYLYGGQDSFSFFNRKINKCMPFVQTPLRIQKSNGTPNFGYTWSLLINNDDGDYVTNVWLEAVFPEIKLKETNVFGKDGRIRWTENLMHNCIEECHLMFNDVIVSKLDNFSLDFLAEFNTEEFKYDEYMKKIGNVSCLTDPTTTLNSKRLFLPLPLFFTKDTGNAIPLAALPHTEIKINIKLKSWENLLILENANAVDANFQTPVVGRDIYEIPKIESAKMFGNFITVTEEERSKIAIKNRIMLIEQIQTLPRQMINKDSDNKIDLLFKHSVKNIFFAARNTTFKNTWSNYNHGHDNFTGGIFTKNKSNNIVKSASIKYNERIRVEEMDSEYYSYVNPYYYSTRIPKKSGLHMYSYSLDQCSSDPTGGVSLSRIDSPTLNINLTDESKESKDSFELVVTAVTNNIIKITEGVVSFPLNHK